MPLRVLITGADGFVGPHLGMALHRLYSGGVTIFATSQIASKHPRLGDISALDVLDRAAVRTSIAGIKPTHIVHLAGIAAIGRASSDPDLTWRVNLHGTQNIADAILSEAPECWMLNVGSGLIYGETANRCDLLDEHSLVAPIDQYGASKAAADLALGVLAKQGLKVIRLRPFNHTGAGQSDAFAIPAFARQIALIEAGLGPPVLKVGNLDTRRDFLDVRDVAAAYALTTKHSDSLGSGVIVNIASGIAYRIGDLLENMLKQSRTRIAIEIDPTRLRESDIPAIAGNSGLARHALGWSPQFGIDETIQSVLADWRERIKS